MRSTQSNKIDAVFSALSHPVRREILHAVSEQQKTIVELAEPYDMSLNAVSKHIKRLESAGLVKRAREGSQHRISLNAAAMKIALQWMSRYVPFWHANLHNLKASLEED